MKLLNPRAGWGVEGTLVGLIHRRLPLTAQEMASYFIGISYGTVLYKQLRRSCFFDRTVVLTEDHRFILVPMTPDVQIIPTEEHS